MAQVANPDIGQIRLALDPRPESADLLDRLPLDVAGEELGTFRAHGRPAAAH